MCRNIATILVVLLIPAVALAGVTGKISGVVSDRDEGGPLPGANVVLEGAPVVIGATTDAEGRYILLNVPPGTYDLKGSFIGYQDLVVKGVQVSPDMTTGVDFTLSQLTLEAEAITVIATRPLVQKDQTGSIRLLTNEDMANLPVRGYAGVTALQAGVTDHDGTIYIRGGRSEEVAYYVDGFSQQNLLTGGTSTSINNKAIDQVVVSVGGFEAEYGRVMSGIVNVVTKEGGNDYSGSVEYITDEATTTSWAGAPSFGYNNVEWALGGPILPDNNRIRFFVSGGLLDQKDGSPSWGVTAYEWEKDLLTADEYSMLKDGLLPHREYKRWSWQSKLTFRVSDRMDLKMGYLGSSRDSETYSHQYRYNLAHSPISERSNHSFFTKVTYTLSPKTFFTVAGNWFNTSYKGGDGVHFDDIKAYGRPDGNPRFDAEALFMSWDVDSTATEAHEDGGLKGDEGHVYDDYEQTKSSYITPIDFDLTSQVNANHQVRFGFDYQMHTLRYFRHLFPTLSYRGAFVDADDRGGFQDLDNYGYDFDWASGKIIESDEGRNDAKKPRLASIYLQDKIEFEGLVVNVGLRYDYLNAKTDVLSNEAIPLGGDSRLDAGDLAGNKAYHKLSPRLGIGFPVTDKTVFHANYGVFYQQPRLEDLYVGLNYLEYKAPLGGYYYAFGNPNLKPEQTTAYEVGVARQVGRTASLDVTAYYKAIENLVEVTTIPSTPAAFSSYRNRDFGTVKGVDMSLRLRRTNRVSGSLSYSLAYASGTGSSAETQRNIAWGFQPGVTEPPKTTSPLDFDQRHKLTVSVDYRFADEDGPRFMGGYPLSNTGLNLLFKSGSGFPYTPTFVFNEVTLASVTSRPSGPINSSYGPWSYRTDLKANKQFGIGGMDAELYVWVFNLMDRKNPGARDREARGVQSAVYAATGSLETTGWLSTEDGRKFVERFEEGQQKYNLRELDPRNFGSPRQVRIGMALSF
jgi:outer membrane receptor protein involved in Fe transport